MITIGVHDAKTQLSRLLQRAAAGEDVVITRDGEPVARLVRIGGAEPRPLGLDAGTVTIAPDFDALPDEVIAAFEQ